MDASALAHGIHYAIVAAGIVGILALLVPMHLPVGDRAPRDTHEARVLLLRAEIAAGSLGRPTTGSGSVLVTAEPASQLAPAERMLLPVAFVGSAAAAGVHAAMAPSHFGHTPLFGAFFVTAALLQISWAATLILSSSRQLLLAGAALNAGFIGLWAVTRTLGLPVVMTTPEAVGPWDVACVAWQAVVVMACLRLLGTVDKSVRLAAWHRWDGRATSFAVGSAMALATLSFSGYSG